MVDESLNSLKENKFRKNIDNITKSPKRYIDKIIFWSNIDKSESLDER